jgi:hypothetical protein
MGATTLTLPAGAAGARPLLLASPAAAAGPAGAAAASAAAVAAARLDAIGLDGPDDLLAADGGCLLAADLDADGRDDVVLADRRGALRWYRPVDRTATTLLAARDGAGPDAADAEVADGGIAACDAADVDGDGDADLVVASATALAWLENPGTSAAAGPALDADDDEAAATPAPWDRHVVADLDVAPSGLALASISDDSGLDIVTADAAGIHLWVDLHGAWSSWLLAPPSAAASGGSSGPGPLVVGDLDGDGDADLVSGDGWLVDPGPSAARGGPWPVRALPVDGPAAVATGDVDGDGRTDLVTVTAAGAARWSRLVDADVDAWTDAPLGPGQDAASASTASASAAFAGASTAGAPSVDAAEGTWAAIGEVDGDGWADVVLSRPESTIVVLDAASSEPATITGPAVGRFVLADLDGDHAADILATGVDGRLLAVRPVLGAVGTPTDVGTPPQGTPGPGSTPPAVHTGFGVTPVPGPLGDDDPAAGSEPADRGEGGTPGADADDEPGTADALDTAAVLSTDPPVGITEGVAVLEVIGAVQPGTTQDATGRAVFDAGLLGPARAGRTGVLGPDDTTEVAVAGQVLARAGEPTTAAGGDDGPRGTPVVLGTAGSGLALVAWAFGRGRRARRSSR